MATAGKVRATVAGLPAVSLTVTVTAAVSASAVAVGVPVIAPLAASMASPGGRSAAV